MTSSPSAVVRLPGSFDVQRLEAELEAVGTSQFKAQRTFDRSRVTAATTVDWRVLPLRSPGGDPERTDPGGPGTVEYADTPWIRETPYMASILDSLPTTLRTARLMVLAPGAEVDEHRDYPYGPGAGWVRLHVPILTNDRAASVIDGQKQQWQPGTFWYGDFSLPHSVYNRGTTNRVHLVVDCYVNRALLDLFPEEFRNDIRWTEVLLNPDVVPLSSEDLDACTGRVGVPAAFLQGDGPEALIAGGAPDLPAQLRRDGDRLLLDVEGADAIALVHVGGGLFRTAGWTTERTVHIHPVDGGLTAGFRVRYGSRVAEETRRGDSRIPTAVA
ncbi:aspartyl/asparaginyl beta-hydroxylase domain-containing protein [Nocardiopsis quinghaiensis]|uniref:aspartyl/asparaginyl beta-hydroxylase domain-containing protein n=1 Tax=Nocardiopsis quinghaiensis TaxID=464995 RepID=UPI00123BE890|nr:aspartyl/asparaginyl beta-hydroxylase domain-containing protein [Nocardiopsis quinghaiensis]